MVNETINNVTMDEFISRFKFTPDIFTDAKRVHRLDV